MGINSARVKHERRRAFLKLKEKYQFIDPFKFIIYSDLTGHETPQLRSER